jgi:anti-sigma regulatory factor (Ser/Thr protein kinase)
MRRATSPASAEMPTEISLPLPRQAAAAKVARRAIRDRLAHRLGAERTHDLSLLVTELVTNAVVHGQGSITLKIRVDDGNVYGEVIDEGGGFEHELRERGADEVGGRGLAIVDALSSRWGIHEGTTHVWFELAGPEAQTEQTEPQLGDAQRPNELDRPA